MRTADDESVAVETKTLYDLIVDVTRLEYDPEDHKDHDGYKVAVVRFLSGAPYKDMGDEEFVEAVGPDIAKWADTATRAFTANRGARNPKPLPHLEGLDPEPEEAPVKEAKAREKAPAAARTPRAPAEKKERTERNPENNRYFRVAEIMLNKPGMTLAQLGEASKKAGHDYSDVTLRRAHEAFRAVRGAFIKHELLAE